MEADHAHRATKQARVVRGPPVESPDSESDMDLPSQELKERVETPEIERTSRMRLLESSRGSARVDINALQCLGIVKRKGARAGGPPVQSRKDDLKKGHAVITKWGPCIIKSRCVGGWNCNFRDGHPGGWYVEFKDMLLGPTTRI